jgi:hypothetical protein
MKNIHVLSTDKKPIKNVGDLVKDKYGDIHIFTKNDGKEYGKTTTKLNIYITSDEDIKEGDWYLDTVVNVLFKNDKIFLNGLGYKKIILTTDQDLIADGLQSIDDEFLEWFIKNPSCEIIEVEKAPYDGTKSIDKYWGGEYKIIIPKPTQQVIDEDFDGGLTMGEIIPKEETTQESYICPHTKSQCYDECCVSAEDCHIKAQISILSNAPIDEIGAIAAGLCEHLEAKEQSMFIAGFQECAKWMQQEQMYNEEDVKSAFLDGWQLRDGDLPFPKAKKKWFNEFKNK